MYVRLQKSAAYILEPALPHTSILVKIHLISNLKLRTAFTPHCCIQHMDQ
ncbi:hypothetical protein M2408_001090 [Sphingobacterium sp. BIGb0165]|nr:hypothetical protein [Sphingobacterium sp. BIGb0165]